MSEIQLSRTQKALRLIIDEGISAKEAAERVGITKAAVSKGKLHPSKTQQRTRMFFEMQQEIESLRRELENERARDIHSCGPDCTRSGCVNRRLWEELAASQAREQKLRELIDKANGKLLAATMCHPNAVEVLVEEAYQVTTKALALPADTTALEAMIAKAGDVMRERCAQSGMLVANNGIETAGAIRALPGVTLEDIK